MTEEEKIFAGELFCPGDPSLCVIKLRTHKLCIDYNRLYEDQKEERNRILRSIVGKLGENAFMQGPIQFHYGIHTRIGENFFANFNLTVQDDAPVTIGDRCNFGPGVTIVTPIHPMLPGERYQMLDKNGNPRRFCYAKPVIIGNDCWLCANDTVLPGVTIGNGCVIGAGSVVTRDIPANSFAAGNPCRMIRTLGDADSMKYKPDILADNAVIESE